MVYFHLYRSQQYPMENIDIERINTVITLKQLASLCKILEVLLLWVRVNTSIYYEIKELLLLNNNYINEF